MIATLLLLLAGSLAYAGPSTLPISSLDQEGALQAIQRALDEKFSVFGDTIVGPVLIHSTGTFFGPFNVFTKGNDLIISTATGPSGFPGAIFVKGLTGHVGVGTSSPDEVMEVQTRGNQGGILITTGSTNYGTVIGNYQGGTQNDFYSLLEPALPNSASPETLLRLNNQYNGSVWVGPRTDGGATGTFYPGAVAGAGGDCSIEAAPLPKLFVCNDKASAWAGVIYTTATSANGLRVRNTNGTGTILQLEKGGSVGGNMAVSSSAVSQILTVAADGHTKLTGRFDVFSNTSPVQSAANGSTFKIQHPTSNDVMLNAGGNGENLRLGVEGSTAVTISSLAYVGFGRDPRYQVDASSYANASALCISGACNTIWPAALSGAANGAVAVANSLGTQFVPNSLFIARSSAVWINLTPDSYNAFGHQPTLGLATPTGASGPTVSLVSDGSQNAQLAYFNGTTFQWIWAYDKALGASDNMTLYNSAGTRVVNVEQSGDFGLNDKTPDGQLDIVSNQAAAGYIVSVSSQTDTTGSIFAIKGNGFVGIGSANPTVVLDVAGSVSATSFAGIGTDLTFMDASDITMGTLAVARLPSDGYASTYVNVTGDQMTGPLLTTTATISGTGVTGASSIFNVAGATLTVLLNRNVGIGTSSPLHPLHLMHSDDGAVSGLPIATTLENTAGSANLLFKSGTTDCNAIFSSSMTAAALLANNGSKVIQMEMCGPSNPSIFRIGEASLGNTLFVDVTNMGLGITQAPGSSNLFVVGNSSMVVSRAGFVGIGMASPSNPFQVLSNTFTVTTAGQVGVGTSNPIHPLHVVGSIYNTGQSIVGGTLTVQGASFSVSVDTFVVTGGGIVIGASTMGTNNSAAPTKLKVVYADNASGSIVQESYAPATPVTRWISRASSGTFASPALIQASRQIVVHNGQGYDGTAFINAAQITMDVDGTPGANDMPGRIIFHTTADGAAASSERLRIDSKGHFEYSGTAPTITAGCGVGPTVTGNDNALKLNIGTGGVATSCTLTFNGSWTYAPVCSANNTTSYLLTRAASTTTTVVISAATAFTASDVIDVICKGVR